MSMNLGPGQLVSWNRSCGLFWLMPAGLIVAATGVALSFSVGSYAVPLIVGGAGLALVGSARVSVDDSGVSVASTLLPFVRRRIPLDKITRAWSKEDTTLTELAGFGYRIQPGRTAVALRPGNALWLRLRTGNEFVITTDNAEDAAKLVNALITRKQQT
ncbi:hypothetical protein [Streptomyces alkaliterrae]|uniref:DUF3093 family protein n=1 Tax=Streptomyces alkaliterrae TaxID=2213162 RepID=A0A5P0YWZ3_9ACTN|nr:hypothetical protein [Streptomyces alkaliterrae]MBB1256027.1 hypothetical protein [Streptomyces alkaliterrae]MBB1262017.1 hypothetical protein [Streptomyces alkaliterrae]MQS04805.1 hypothetical protein [Streptomyces alkaliterrae]